MAWTLREGMLPVLGGREDEVGEYRRQLHLHAVSHPWITTGEFGSKQQSGGGFNNAAEFTLRRETVLSCLNSCRG